MQVTDSVLEELNSRINIVDLISQHVDLKKAGRNFMGLCPFHSEKSPSFSISEEKGLFHCFGCKASGNAITFIMKYNNFDFIQAVQYLCEKYNVEFEQKEIKGKKEILSINEILLSVAKTYLYSGNYKHALDYLKNRGFDSDSLDIFDIGFLPDDIDLKIFKDFSKNDLFDSGLFYRKDGVSKIKFSGRILIPIKNENGKVVGFSGRSIGKTLPKYINSPETKLFKKRELLFNLNLARSFIKSEKNVYVVEGYFDVIRMYAAGYRNTVSPMGTSFTTSQVALLKRLTDEGVVVFDGDEAGFNASFRALDVAVESNFFPAVVFMPEGEDPDSLLLNNPDEFHRLVKKKQDMMLNLFRGFRKRSETLAKRNKTARELFEKTEKIKDSVMKNFYQSELSKIFNIDIELLKLKPESQKYIKDKNIDKPDVSYFCEEEFIYCIINLDYDLMDDIISDMTEEMFMGIKTKNIFNKIVEFSKNSDNILVLLNDADCGEDLSKMILKYGEVSSDIHDNDYFHRTSLLNKQKIRKNYLNLLKTQIISMLSSGNLSSDESSQFLVKLQDIVKQEKNIQTD